MPILAVDQFGRIYEASPDRADGKGYKSHPSKAERGDLTLGNAYLKSEKTYQKDVLQDRQIQEIMDKKEEYRRKEYRKQLAKNKIKEASEEALRSNDQHQNNLKRRALQMGCDHPAGQTVLSGDPLTANGQKGWQGMDHTQKVIHHHLSGLGELPSVAHKADPMEIYQAQIRSQADSAIQAEARRKAKIVVQEQQQALLEKGVREGRIHVKSPVTGAFASKIVSHPLLNLEVKRRVPSAQTTASSQLSEGQPIRKVAE